MVNVIAELSKYLILTLMLLYTFQFFHILTIENIEDQKMVMLSQMMLTFFMDSVAFAVIYLKTREFEVIIFYMEVLLLFTVIQVLYRLVYKEASILLINNMCMLLSVGFIMLARLDMDKAQRQLMIVAAVSAVSFVVPFLIRKMKFLRKLTWVYAGVGVVLLAAVLVLARTTYGAKLSLMGVQPSEAIKLTFVFFLAALMWKNADFKTIVKATIVAGLHVGILVLSTDLGSAVIFFVTYVVMVYVASKKLRYVFLGVAGGSVAAVIAYHLFYHVQQRVLIWQDPILSYDEGGYQIAQSLFGIGTGGWFGMGLCQGNPEVIPVVTNDFIFAAICEELGGIFGVCLILVCMSFFLLIVNIALQIKNPFYKLIALGLGTEYAFQVFLTIGGGTKFIPLTGVTLPLVSYGGSSVMSTLLMLAVIQGLYILREDEDEEIERYRQEAAKKAGQGAERNRKVPKKETARPKQRV
ncbi:MAG: FtsW/RodA/SpoVE family cell cycle protein [Eubacteriales bacterium]|nr:FtsW/RodA/SpoVE family cell cycle protein [Eubacteriales bacterium]